MSNFTYKPASQKELEREARDWAIRVLTPRDWKDAPEAVSRVAASSTISLRIPTQMLSVLKACAQQQGVGYQVLLKRWLDDRIRAERDKLAMQQIQNSYEHREVLPGGNPMDFKTILLKKEAGIATLTLNRPERMNAVNQTVHEEMLAALLDVKQDESVRVLILTGKGRAFCAGGDFKGDRDSLVRADEWPQPKNFIKMYRSLIQPFIMGLQSLEIPTIAMVNGPAYGVGFDFALACDLRLGSPQTRFCAAWLRRGITTAGGTTWLLPRQVGVGKAAEIIFFAREVGAEEAERLGILNKLVPANQLEAETMEWARQLARGAPMALRLSKMNLYRGLELDLPAALDMLATSQGIALSTEDYKEATRAFREKREAVFRGE